MRLLLGLLLLVAALIEPARAQACLGETACTVPLGSYHVALPARAAGDTVPAVLFFHGYGGSGLGAIRNAGMIGRFIRRGYAVIAPNGIAPDGVTDGVPDSGARTNWTLPGGRDTGRDDVAFTLQLVDDAIGRFNLDPQRVLVTGFSKGGSFVWHLACTQGDRFRAYAPIAGAFWEPLPASCDAGPVDMMHIHGFTDRTVPIEGRPVGGGAFVQGDTFASLDVLRRTNHCGSDRPDAFVMGEVLACRIWTDCAPGREIRFCLHDGGHGLPKGWVPTVLDWFETLPGN